MIAVDAWGALVLVATLGVFISGIVIGVRDPTRRNIAFVTAIVGAVAWIVVVAVELSTSNNDSRADETGRVRPNRQCRGVVLHHERTPSRVVLTEP